MASRLPGKLSMRGAWLFARAGESIWIHRDEESGLKLCFDGPSGVRHSFSFDDEQQVRDFLSTVEDHLIETGWTFQRYESDADIERRRLPSMRNRLSH